MENTKKLTPCRETYIVLCILIPIWPIIIGIIRIYKSDSTGIWILFSGVGSIFVIAYIISRYYLIVDDLSISCFSILKKTTILRSEITHSKYVWETGSRGFSPVFYIFTSGSENPSMKIRIKNFSKEDVVEIAKMLHVTNYNNKHKNQKNNES